MNQIISKSESKKNIQSNIRRHQYNIWRSESQPTQFHNHVQDATRYYQNSTIKNIEIYPRYEYVTYLSPHI